MEYITKIGTILGYISTAIALFVVIKTGIMSKTDRHILDVAGKTESDKVHSDLDQRLDHLENQFGEFMERDRTFKLEMGKHIESQTEVNKRVLANLIETTYYQNREKRSLDMNEFRRITEAYAIYHGDQIHGNSYITEIYNDMIGWHKDSGL